MNVQKFNVSKPKKYTNRQGEEKTQWNNIGTLTEFHKDDGSVSRILEIPAISLEANLFPFKEEGAPQAPQRRAPNAPAAKDDWGAFNEDAGSEINPEDIPF